jgi:hypothetical protein
VSQVIRATVDFHFSSTIHRQDSNCTLVSEPSHVTLKYVVVEPVELIMDVRGATVARWGMEALTLQMMMSVFRIVHCLTVVNKMKSTMWMKSNGCWNSASPDFHSSKCYMCRVVMFFGSHKVEIVID